MTSMRISLVVTTSDQATAAHVTENLARTAIGLAMDGHEALLICSPDED